MAGFTGVHLLVIAAVLLVLFGATRLPLVAEHLGRSVRILRSGFTADPSPVTPISTPAAPVAGSGR